MRSAFLAVASALFVLPATLAAQGDPSSHAAPPDAPAKPARRIVVIDPGHGGPKTGMLGRLAGGAQFVEKDVTLGISLKLRDELTRRGVDVVMTRTRDTDVELEDRGRIANDAHGDLFISIHVNAPGTSESRASAAAMRGFETYFLAEAKTEDEKRVEAMENGVVRFETSATAHKNDPLSFLINDMAQTEHLRESSDLAETIQHALGPSHPGPSRGVKQANFSVLRNAFMPAVLVETGYGSNVKEAEWLSSVSGQRALAASIADATMEYLKNYERRVSAGGQR
jgi:N-acetylmuramoyl-L-alanine amidase